MFPITILQKGQSIDMLPSGNQYVIAQDGVYFAEQEGLIGSLTKIDEIPHLARVTPYATMWMPPIPQDTASLALSFFRRVWREYRSECELQLYVSQQQSKFLLICPEQEVTGVSVRYKRQPTNTVPATFLRVGSIHSHCNFNAFHSTIDERDEITEDGLHVTFGNVDRQEISIAATICVRKHRFVTYPNEVIEGLENAGGSHYKISLGNHDTQIEEWMTKVRCGLYRKVGFKID